jgi:hypothetical protein
MCVVTADNDVWEAYIKVNTSFANQLILTHAVTEFE